MSNRKDLCPVCKTNLKGIKSKQCRSCLYKREVPELIKPPEIPELSELPPEPPEPPRPKIGKTTPDGMFYE